MALSGGELGGLYRIAGDWGVTHTSVSCSQWKDEIFIAVWLRWCWSQVKQSRRHPPLFEDLLSSKADEAGPRLEGLVEVEWRRTTMGVSA